MGGVILDVPASEAGAAYDGLVERVKARAPRAKIDGVLLAPMVKGGVEKPDVTFTLKDQDWLSIAEGKLDPQSAFFSGKLKVTGDIGLALRLQQIFPTQR